ncbi:MAG TPA: radical SAM/SPASM domain-containing protein, partial [Candidatus Binatia bacterium]|nr:radical SAM/SPASM domain-containing protein [Candidatus Binatia bacterium]
SSIMTGKTDYYRRLFALFRSYRRRDLVVPVPPLRIWVELSSRCNLRCPFCPNRDLPAKDKGDMDWTLFKKIIDQARGFACEINLHHRGESLLHPEAGRFIQYASRQGVFSKLHTNGTLLMGKLGDEILASGLQRLSVSFDGVDAASYEKNRVGANFEQVTENIGAFLRRRRQLGRTTPRLAIETMRVAPARSEAKKQKEFFRRFKDLGLDELVLKETHNWAGHLPATAALGKFSACTFPWNALVVFFDGTVTPCAQDFFGRLGLGNAVTAPLLEIWNGPPMQRLRRAFADGDLSETKACSDCDRIRRRTLGGIPREYLKRMVAKRMP